MEGRLTETSPGVAVPDKRQLKNKNFTNGNATMQLNTRKRAAKILLAIGLRLAGPGLHAQENRKVLNNPTPTYPETARRFRLSGVVKV